MADIGFGDKLSALCAMELATANGNADRIGGMIERLLNSLSFTIAIAAKGNPELMQEMLTGADGYLYEAAATHRTMGEFMATAAQEAPDAD